MQASEQSNHHHWDSEGTDEERDHGDNGGALRIAGEQHRESENRQERTCQREDGGGAGENHGAESGECGDRQRDGQREDFQQELHVWRPPFFFYFHYRRSVPNRKDAGGQESAASFFTTSSAASHNLSYSCRRLSRSAS